MTAPNLRPAAARVNAHDDDEPWRCMTAEDALASLVDADAAQRTLEGRRTANRLGLVGIANKRRLVAWRRENQLCPKCGRGLPADEPFKHCPRCRRSFREHQRRVNANLTEPQRLARNARARKSYYKITHGKPPPPKVVAPVVTPVVTPDPVVTRSAKVVTRDQKTGAPLRDRAAYMREYRSGKADRKAEAKS